MTVKYIRCDSGLIRRSTHKLTSNGVATTKFDEYGRKRLLDDDIQIITIEVPQLSALAPAKKSGRNINCVLREEKARHIPLP